ASYRALNSSDTPAISALSLHDALPISSASRSRAVPPKIGSEMSDGKRPRRVAEAIRKHIAEAFTREFFDPRLTGLMITRVEVGRSEEHTSELQSREKLVCRLLLEKKKE